MRCRATALKVLTGRPRHAAGEVCAILSGLIKLLSSPVLEAREQAVWALGNIAGDNPVCRDYVLKKAP